MLGPSQLDPGRWCFSSPAPQSPKIMDRSPGGRGAYQSGTSTQSSGSSTLRKGWLCPSASMKLARPTYTQVTVTAHCGHLPLQSIPSEQSHAFLGQEGRSRGGVRRPIAAAQGQMYSMGLRSLVLLPMSTTRACSGYVASEGTWKIPQGLCVSVASLTAARPARPAVQRRWRKCNNVWRMMLKGEEEPLYFEALCRL